MRRGGTEPPLRFFFASFCVVRTLTLAAGLSETRLPQSGRPWVPSRDSQSGTPRPHFRGAPRWFALYSGRCRKSLLSGIMGVFRRLRRLWQGRRHLSAAGYASLSRHRVHRRVFGRCERGRQARHRSDGRLRGPAWRHRSAECCSCFPSVACGCLCSRSRPGSFARSARSGAADRYRSPRPRPEATPSKFSPVPVPPRASPPIA
jgi:hypothetical protein